MALRLADCHVRLPLSVSDDLLMRAEGGGPIPKDISGEPTVMDGFIHLIRMNVIVQDIVETLYTPKWLNQKMPLEADWEEAGNQDPSNAGPGWEAGTKKPEYKDMIQLSKKLDEWEAKIPVHVSNINTSPFRLQAGILSCGKHDLRMYIYKPFLSDVNLRRTLHPQCVPHARECVKTVNDLYEAGDAASMVFLFQQAFMSTATFLITVWHTYEEDEGLAQDHSIIESTLKMFNSLENRFSSPIFRKAHRMIRNIAARCLRNMARDQQDRVTALIKVSDPYRLTGGRSGIHTPAHAQAQAANNLVPGTASPSAAALSAFTQWAGNSPLGTPGASGAGGPMNSRLANRRGSGMGEYQHPFSAGSEHPPHLGVATPSNAALFNDALESELESLGASEGTFEGLGMGIGGAAEDPGWTDYFTKFLSELGSGPGPATNPGGEESRGLPEMGPLNQLDRNHSISAGHNENGSPTGDTNGQAGFFTNHSSNLNLHQGGTNSGPNNSQIFTHYSSSNARAEPSTDSHHAPQPRTRPPTPSFIRSRPQTPNGLPLGLTPPPHH